MWDSLPFMSSFLVCFIGLNSSHASVPCVRWIVFEYSHPDCLINVNHFRVCRSSRNNLLKQTQHFSAHLNYFQSPVQCCSIVAGWTDSDTVLDLVIPNSLVTTWHCVCYRRSAGDVLSAGVTRLEVAVGLPGTGYYAVCTVKTVNFRIFRYIHLIDWVQ